MPADSFTLPSFAKINWFLKISGKRNDGFHELCTIFQTISLCDNITFSESPGLLLECDQTHIPVDENNLIIKAAHSIRAKYNVNKGASIFLEKKIPSPGGLGGGSSNAAIAVLGLLKLWNLKTDFDDVLQICAELGSDVPFFLYGGTALGTGRGTEIERLNDQTENHLLIVTPPETVSTAAAFAELNAPHLTNERAKSNLQICRNEARTLNLRQTLLINDFEQSVFRAAPQIGRVKQRLLEAGAVQAVLSGSGASVFAIFDKEETRQTAQKAIENESYWRSFAVAAVSSGEYRETLKSVYQLASD